MHNKHIFAVHTVLSEQKLVGTVKIDDKIIFHRVVRVLRLEIEDKFVLFNLNFNFLVKIKEINKNDLSVEILQKNKNEKLKPNIIVLLSLLKKDSLEEALYYCVELGANSIQPVITQKSQKNINIKEGDRLKKILISAAEQSKNFNIPELKEPVVLNEAINLDKTNFPKIYFDHKGESLAKVLNIYKKDTESLILFIGPEGDLTEDEKQLVKESNFIFCSLTPTILRAQTALSLAIGTFRSYFR